MSLTDYQRKLLTRAAEIIAAGNGGFDGKRFVCLAITEANHEFGGRLDDEKTIAALELRNRVERALNGHYTFDSYFYIESGCRPKRNEFAAEGTEDARDLHGIPKQEFTYLSYEEFYNLTRLARIAWIERMLDNNEVA